VTGVREIILKRNLSNFVGAEISVRGKNLWGRRPNRPRGVGAYGKHRIPVFPYRKDIETKEKVQWRATMQVKNLKYIE
jgi:hypothetical protein